MRLVQGQTVPEVSRSLGSRNRRTIAGVRSTAACVSSVYEGSMPTLDNLSESSNPVIRNCSHCLVHVPDLVRYGSKPRREIVKDPNSGVQLAKSLRTYDEAVCYPPNQTVIGNLSPEGLAAIPRPWFKAPAASADGLSSGPYGEIVSQDAFYGLLGAANVLTPPLVEISRDSRDPLQAALSGHAALAGLGDLAFGNPETLRAEAEGGRALPLWSGQALRGVVRRDDRAEGREDDNLDAPTLLEALCTKASGVVALRWLLQREGIAATEIDYVISCGEEAAGDRYQRGGGGMAKAIAEMCGCVNASGMDVKNFCAGPASALITAGALVKAGLYRRVAVVGGGSLAKLGMKYQAFLRNDMPVLGDCLGAMAFLVIPDDGASPILHLEPGSVGLARIGASTSDQAIYHDLIVAPTEALGLAITDIDKFAPELHNPELMEFSGSGDVAHKNYRLIAATAVKNGAITKSDMEKFIERIGMVGFAPPQGHIPSAMPFMGHAMAGMRNGEIRRAMFLSKASLFLNRLTELYDGISFVLEANRGNAR